MAFFTPTQSNTGLASPVFKENENNNNLIQRPTAGGNTLLGQLIQAFVDAENQANLANEQRYQDILSGLSDLVQGRGALTEATQQGYGDLAQTYQQGFGDILQGFGGLRGQQAQQYGDVGAGYGQLASQQAGGLQNIANLFQQASGGQRERLGGITGGWEDAVQRLAQDFLGVGQGFENLREQQGLGLTDIGQGYEGALSRLVGNLGGVRQGFRGLQQQQAEQLGGIEQGFQNLLTGLGQGDRRLSAGYEDLIQQLSGGDEELAGQFRDLIEGQAQRHEGILGGHQERVGRAAEKFGQLEGDWRDRYERNVNRIEQVGEEEIQDINERWDQREAEARQNLISRGLGNSTIAQSVLKGIEEGRGRDLGRAAERIAQLKTNVDMQASSDALQSGERFTLETSDMLRDLLGEASQLSARKTATEQEESRLGERALQRGVGLGERAIGQEERGLERELGTALQRLGFQQQAEQRQTGLGRGLLDFLNQAAQVQGQYELNPLRFQERATQQQTDLGQRLLDFANQAAQFQAQYRQNPLQFRERANQAITGMDRGFLDFLNQAVGAQTNLGQRALGFGERAVGQQTALGGQQLTAQQSGLEGLASILGNQIQNLGQMGSEQLGQGERMLRFMERRTDVHPSLERLTDVIFGLGATGLGQRALGNLNIENLESLIGATPPPETEGESPFNQTQQTQPAPQPQQTQPTTQVTPTQSPGGGSIPGPQQNTLGGGYSSPAGSGRPTYPTLRTTQGSGISPGGITRYPEPIFNQGTGASQVAQPPPQLRQQALARFANQRNRSGRLGRSNTPFRGARLKYS